MISWIGALDAHVLAYLFAVRDPAGALFMANVSMWSEWTIIIPLVGTMVCLLWFARRHAEATGFALAVFGGSLAVLVLKYTILRPRPDMHFWAVQEIGPSFPSAHSALAIVFWGFLAYLVWRNVKSAGIRWLATAAAVGISLLVGFSRLYLGVHYLSDVIAGFGVGALFLVLGIMLTRRRGA